MMREKKRESEQEYVSFVKRKPVENMMKIIKTKKDVKVKGKHEATPAVSFGESHLFSSSSVSRLF